MSTEKRCWKFYLGVALFVYSFIPSSCSGLLFLLNVPMKAHLTEITIFIASGQIAFLISITLLGKTIIQAFKAKFYDLFKLKFFKLDSYYISYTRHLSGIILLIISFIPYIIAELLLVLGYPIKYGDNYLVFYILISGDILFIISLFSLGSGFWERLKDLFKWHPGKKTEQSSDCLKN